MSPLVYELLATYGHNPFEAFLFIFGHGGALLIPPVMIIYGWKGWLEYIRERTKQRRKWSLFRIEVPQNNEQSMKAVEQIFAQMNGTVIDHPHNLIEKYWDGFVQENVSLEIVSDGGYINFYFWAPHHQVEAVQASFYAQYPDAIISEAEDYSKVYTADLIIKKEILVWGSEMKLNRDDVYPIRSWPNWEHPLPGRAIDPLAAILEVMSRLKPGEQWWLQLMLQPEHIEHFKHRAQHAIDVVVEPTGGHTAPNVWDKILELPLKVLEGVHDTIFPGDYAPTHDMSGRLIERQRLTSPERELVEVVDRKMSRWIFKSKLRFMYFAPPHLFDPHIGHHGMLGALSQFMFVNWFIEGKNTRVDKRLLQWRWIFSDVRTRRRARRMFWAYRSKDMERGEHNGFILSTEEACSIYHFPQIEVRAPFVAKATTRGVEPPTQLRYGDVEAVAAAPTVSLEPTPADLDTPPAAPSTTEPAPSAQPQSAVPSETQPPSNLPFVE